MYFTMGKDLVCWGNIVGWVSVKNDLRYRYGLVKGGISFTNKPYMRWIWRAFSSPLLPYSYCRYRDCHWCCSWFVIAPDSFLMIITPSTSPPPTHFFPLPLSMINSQYLTPNPLLSPPLPSPLPPPTSVSSVEI